jgi:aminoglycoside phosphotransferase family enzyme
VLAEFYASRPAVATPLRGYLAWLENELMFDRKALLAARFHLPGETVQTIANIQLRVLRDSPRLFDERLGRIVEGHGDLRPEHICLEERPVIIDRLEFDRRWRVLDPASELAFLWLECERLGAPRFGRIVFERYCRLTRDYPSRPLMEFYRRWHACLRARLALSHLRDRRFTVPNKWTDRAESYLRLALIGLEGPAFWLGG